MSWEEVFKQMFGPDQPAEALTRPATEVSLDHGPAPEPAPDRVRPEPVVNVAQAVLKGEVNRLFVNQQFNQSSDRVEMSQWNMLHVDVRVTGSSASATITIQGDDGTGNYVALPDPLATKTAVGANVSYDVVVGTRYARVDISSISGSYTAGQGFTVIVTPFRSGAASQADGANAVFGITTGAAVVTDTAGTIQQYLRGIVKLIVDKISVISERKAATATATIADGQSLSGEVDLGGHALVGLVIPSGWQTATSITFQVASATGGTFVNLYDDAGNEVTVTVAASRGVGCDAVAGALAPWRFIKVRSGTSGSAVAQAGGDTITLVLKA